MTLKAREKSPTLGNSCSFRKPNFRGNRQIALTYNTQYGGHL
jgi:hypothetical protein